MAPHKIIKGKDLYLNMLQAITTGRYVPGQRLSERELAMELKASRTPVREVFRLLMQDGLITHEPRRGYRIVQISEERARQVMAVRGALEGLAARLACEINPKRTAEAMETTIKQAYQAHKQGNLSGLISANQKFHLLLVQGSGNPILQSLYHNIQVYVGLMMSVSLAWPRRPDQTLKEHNEIIQALIKGNPDKAEECVKNHVCKATQGMLRNIKSYFESVPEQEQVG